MKILKAGPGFSQPMTENEIITFLTSGKRNIYLATLDEKLSNIYPVWYYFDVSKHKFYIETSKYSKKRKNTEKNDIIYYCVDDSNYSHTGERKSKDKNT